jgi:hypothetical protein
MNAKKFSTIVYGTESGKKNNIIYVREEDFEIPHGEDYKITIEVLNKIQYELFENSYLSSSLLYENVSLWWFIYQTLVGRLKKQINFIRKFSDLLDEINPSIVEITEDFQFVEIIKQICIKKNIDLSFSKRKYFQYGLKIKAKNTVQKSRYKKIFNSKTQIRLDTFLKSKNNIPSLKNKLLFIVPTFYRRKFFDTKKKIFTNGEYIQQSIINLLDNDQVVGIDVDYTFSGDKKILQERLAEIIPWIPFEYFINNNKNKMHSIFVTNYLNLISSSNFQQLFIYDEISLWPVIKHTFYEMSFGPYIPFYLKIIDSFKKYFSMEPPKSVFLPYETGPMALAIIAVCKKLGIQTIGIQHGYIYKYSSMYCFGPFINKDHNSSFPIPDKTLLFGDYVKQMLIDDGYPAEKLVVFGNPAFFDLEKITDIIDPKKLQNFFSIRSNQKIILFTTGKLQRCYTGHGKYDYDEQIWKKLLQSFGNDSNYYIILKPHPAEKNIAIYKQILEENFCDNAAISDDGIFELIFASTILVSVFSSTIFDSMFFKKPTIRVKFKNEKHPIFDTTEGVFTSSFSELQKNIIKIVNNKNDLNHILNESKKLLKEHYGLPINNPGNILNEIIENKT